MFGGLIAIVSPNMNFFDALLRYEGDPVAKLWVDISLSRGIRLISFVSRIASPIWQSRFCANPLLMVLIIQSRLQQLPRLEVEASKKGDSPDEKIDNIAKTSEIFFVRRHPGEEEAVK